MRFVTFGLAGLGPLALWAIVYVAVMGFRDAEQSTADANAGRVLNARVVPDDVVTTIDRLLEARSPRVIVIGPSYANTNVRPVPLAEALGLRPSEIAILSVPNSVGSHWYAILRYRVLEAGHRPELLLVVSGLQSMLLNTPLSESSFVNLQVHLPAEGDPVIDERVRGGANLWWATLREQRGKVRGAFFDSVRDAVVFWQGPDATRQALGRVFDDAKIDMGLYEHAMPVIESSRQVARAFTPDLLPSPEESFLGDTTALATAAGITTVWVRPPMSPHIPAELDDVAPAGFQARAVEVVGGAGGAFVDLRHLPMSAQMFRNEDHMNTEGSKRFSRALAAVVAERGWLDDGEPPVAPEPVEDPVPVGPALELFGSEGLTGGVALETPRTVPGVPQARREPVDLPGRVASFDTSRFAFLSAEALEGTASWSQPCSPLRIAEDGRLLGRSNVPCPEVRSQGHGRSCHTRQALFFTASDRTDPAHNGRRYGLRLAEDRVCGGEVFLYPRDLLRFTIAPYRLKGLASGVGSLVLRGRYLQRRAAQLVVRVRAGNATVLEHTVDGTAFERGPVELSFDPVVQSIEVPWIVEIENLQRTFYLFRGLSLTAGRPDQ